MPTIIVIDTNIWLDLVVFADPRAAALRVALESQVVKCFRSPRMLEELADVISRSMFGLSLEDQGSVLARARELSNHAEPGSDRSKSLLCRDPDDQMFLDLALDLPATVLLSKDRALLRLASKARSHNLLITASWPNPPQT
jgi:putative PIN family toxin of toxin-antitoxin system